MIHPQVLAALSPLLDEALDLPDSAARQRWLDRLGPEHEALKPMLVKLLADAGISSSPLDRTSQLAALVGHPVAVDRLAAGERLGSYRLVRELGRGGMSVVWLAQPAAPGSEVVALKLPAISLDSSGLVQRFEREKDFLRQLDHPNIARLVDVGVTEAGQQYLALEYVDGQPLDEYCDTHQLGLRDRITLLLQVLQAVQHAHERSILHRDLKPSNILVTADGVARLLDFGIAKLLVDGQASETELTELWGRALTRDYASPEQLAGQTVTASSDVYALGVILYALICGQRPHRQPFHARQAGDAPSEHPEPIPPSEACRPDAVVTRREGGSRSLARKLAGDLDSIALRALRHDPAERYADVASMAAALHKVLADEPVLSRLQRWRASLASLVRRHRAAVSLTSLLMLAIGGLGRSHQWAADLESALTLGLPEPQRVVLVSIGVEDHRNLFGGVSPLAPATLGKLVERILQGQPAVLGVDIDTSAPDFAALRLQFGPAALQRIVWGRDIEVSDQPLALPIAKPVLGSAETTTPVRWGLALSVVEGSSGTVRWFRRHIPTAQGLLPSFAAELAHGLRPPSAGEDDATALRGIRFARADRVELPASVVLADGFDWSRRIEGRVVLLGGRYDRTDVSPTPLGLMHGLEILASTVETELSGRAFVRPHLAAVLGIGLLDLVATLYFFQRFGWPLAMLASLAFGLIVAAVLAVSGGLQAWSYAVMAALAVTANQGVLVLLRQQREAVLRRLGAVWGATSRAPPASRRKD